MLIFPGGQNLQIYVIKKANFKNCQGLGALAHMGATRHDGQKMGEDPRLPEPGGFRTGYPSRAALEKQSTRLEAQGLKLS